MSWIILLCSRNKFFFLKIRILEVWNYKMKTTAISFSVVSFLLQLQNNTKSAYFWFEDRHFSLYNMRLAENTSICRAGNKLLCHGLVYLKSRLFLIHRSRLSWSQGKGGNESHEQTRYPLLAGGVEGMTCVFPLGFPWILMWAAKPAKYNGLVR